MWASRRLLRFRPTLPPLQAWCHPYHHHYEPYHHYLPFSQPKPQFSTQHPTRLIPPSIVGTSRPMSSGKGMRSKLEKQLRVQTAKTLREKRRAMRLRKKLMTEEERLVYSLRRAKKKVGLLLQKLKKYELPELPAPRHDPELLTPEQLQAYKKIGYKNRNYAPVGVRGVFGGVVLNMHLHWKFHETVQVCCDNYPKEKIKEMATMLARLSGGIVIDIHNVNTIIMFRGRNYRQPKNLIPINTLTKRKALFKARFEQALESQKLNIKGIEQKLRRKGVNPEDPVAMASVQRVASTFFRAIDEKQGTPYVFQGENKPLAQVDGAPEDEPALSGEDSDHGEDSDQEELDRFILEIEEAADREWADEEAAEKEEMTRIRYWNKERTGIQDGRPSNWHGKDSDEELNYRGRDYANIAGRRRTTDVRKWTSEDETSESDEDWESDQEVDVDGDSLDDDSDQDADIRPKRNGDASRSKSRTLARGSRMLDIESNSDSEGDLFSESDNTLWDSDVDEHDRLGLPKRNTTNIRGISQREGRGYDRNKDRRNNPNYKSGDSWDSD